MGSIPDPLFDQTSATTVAEFPKRGKAGVKKAPRPKSLMKKVSPKKGRGRKRI